LRILRLIAAARKADAERRAADATRNLDGIDRQAGTLANYLLGLAMQPADDVTTGYDLAILAKFADASAKAVRSVQEARIKGEKVQTAALMTLAAEIDRRDALARLADEQQRSADLAQQRRSGI
jgi:hypothetical protein